MLFYAGQILNRFSKDMGAVDKTLPNIFMDFIQVTIFILLKYKMLNIYLFNYF